VDAPTIASEPGALFCSSLRRLSQHCCIS
jgi:hypothetical protein